MKKGEITIAVAADYSKAFDTINYPKLIKLLSDIGFSKQFLNIINSYLTNRTQFVQIDDIKSGTKLIHFGVPQGSILGPTLFNLYVSDLTTIINNPYVQYADDTTIFTFTADFNNYKMAYPQ